MRARSAVPSVREPCSRLISQLEEAYQASRSSSVQVALPALKKWMDALTRTLRIAVIYGGNRSEPDAALYWSTNLRPWKSYYEVATDIQRALERIGFSDVALIPDDMRMPARLKECGAHLAWINSAGMQGESSICHAAATLEMLGIPYIGHSPLDASLLDSKDRFKRQLESLRIATPEFVVWHPLDGAPEGRIRGAFESHPGPFVVKPSTGRASLNVHFVEKREELSSFVKEVFALTRANVIVERYMSGREFCVAVCGGILHRGGMFFGSRYPHAFSALERRFEPGERIFTSMDRRAIDHDRAMPIPDTDQALKRALLAFARELYSRLRLRSPRESPGSNSLTAGVMAPRTSDAIVRRYDWLWRSSSPVIG
ncbi:MULTISPECIES: D-alanyl-alanine synthetase [Sorangium]|uniref:ATP-grasp domain-containing protein n=1 Tax=Sorangium cellulosum TaxID=56 RepID=A0A4P2QN89_SORCE|nr:MULTISPECIES: D-alanyl-alanine synthetase [Sorangium]AUX31495.1 uncharacterized protein SOCE836_036260 [Sorangium cellulosum]WCQ90874.1 D-alanine--D-alanine ligase [Sorangium sp. Soce836]